MDFSCIMLNLNDKGLCTRKTLSLTRFLLDITAYVGVLRSCVLPTQTPFLPLHKNVITFTIHPIDSI
jgi:hypothetical protein